MKAGCFWGLSSGIGKRPLPKTNSVALGLGHRLPHRTPVLSPRGQPAEFAELLGALLDPEPLAGADLRQTLAVHPPLNQHSLCQALGGSVCRGCGWDITLLGDT